MVSIIVCYWGVISDVQVTRVFFDSSETAKKRCFSTVFVSKNLSINQSLIIDTLKRFLDNISKGFHHSPASIIVITLVVTSGLLASEECISNAVS